MLYVMHIDVLSTKTGIFWKTFHSDLSHPKNLKINFEKFWRQLMIEHLNFFCIMTYLCLEARTLKLFFFWKKLMINFMKNFINFFWKFSFLGLGLKMFCRKWYLGTIKQKRLFQNSKQKISKICSEFDKSECNIFAKDIYFCTQDTNVRHI